ncbi:MAG: malonyl-CoA O-methyltransferase [Candidatus Electronema aureum]|uniref:Malonyl-[acyl-carrier protein] O-methyltransferase n=1 Tax=Candidatus Electronema aureum TaxID=2005002 RepID=A0A521G4F9_9BACT|nr:MAG: malonyl-CoA O-methyltransferase [Candidatus Electronema aureum]
MPQCIDKQLLCRQFQRAANSYEQQALIQQRTAEHLLDLLAQHGGTTPPQRVLEIGCCTGLLTRRLIERVKGMKELVLNDIVPDFAARMNIAALAPSIRLLPGDIENLPLPGTFNLIISSSTFHWLHDLDHLLAQLAVALEPSGTLAFSLYGPDNLREIDELTGIGLEYLSLPEIETIVRRHFKLLHSSSQQEILYFTSPQEVLHHLRQTGVNAINRSPWSRTRLQHFSAEYRQRFSTASGVSLTYQPLYFVARSTHHR